MRFANFCNKAGKVVEVMGENGHLYIISPSPCLGKITSKLPSRGGRVPAKNSYLIYSEAILIKYKDKPLEGFPKKLKTFVKTFKELEDFFWKKVGGVTLFANDLFI